MFDTKVCARVRTEAKPTVSVEGLLKLRSLLDANTTLGSAAYPAGEEEAQGGEDAAAAQTAFVGSGGGVRVEPTAGEGEKRVHSGAEHTTKGGLEGE